MIDDGYAYFLDETEEEYDEESSDWTYNDWIASGVETSADFNQYFDNEFVRLTSLSAPNSTLESSSSTSHALPSDSSSSALVYSLIDLTENCISPALSQLINQLSWILLFCCLFRLLSLSRLLSSQKLHYVQICASVTILYHHFHFQSIYLLTYVLMGYFAFQLCLAKCRPYLTSILVCFSVIYILACEFILIEQEKWHSIRGVQMCIMMKMISLAFDYPAFERPAKTNTDDSVLCPTAAEFFSFILSIHNTIFGPWMNYRNYIRYFQQSIPTRKIDFFELAKWFYYFLRVAICLVVSTCLTDWFLRHYLVSDDEDDRHQQQQGGWRVAYIHALSYRFSHYCVCFIGELCGQVSGLEFDVHEYRNYASICQQAKERIDAERKSREHVVSESTTDIHAGKRRHRNKKNSGASEHDVLTSADDDHNSSHAVENGPSGPVESEPMSIEESDSSIHRRPSKKPALSNTFLLSSKRKLPTRSHSQPHAPSLPIKPVIASTLPSTSHSHSSSIVQPCHIELPHSLVDVVVNWNLPMHYWLKIYVYMPMKHHYGHLSSILVTYLASALLHGFNFQLSIVLFSIGLFAYVEYGFRRKLARILDACVAARSCPSRSTCEQHTYTYWHPLTLAVNACLCLLSLWHLTYLGQLFDGSSQETIGYSWQHVVEKWAKLNFASHLVVIGTYAVFRSL